jgi:hypothetical protein
MFVGIDQWCLSTMFTYLVGKTMANKRSPSRAAGNLHKKYGLPPSKFVQYYILTFISLCDIIYIQSRGEKQKQWNDLLFSRHSFFQKKNFSKTFEKPLDKFPKVWYNKVSKKERYTQWQYLKSNSTRNSVKDI